MSDEGKSKYVWDELSPQERNALVAKHVFGHNVRTSENGMPYKLVYNEFTEEEYSMAVDNYTTDINHAQQVIRKMHEEDYLMEIHDARGFDSYVQCSFGEYESNEHETIAEAVCLAALRAKGVDIE